MLLGCFCNLWGQTEICSMLFEHRMTYNYMKIAFHSFINKGKVPCFFGEKNVSLERSRGILFPYALLLSSVCRVFLSEIFIHASCSFFMSWLFNMDESEPDTWASILLKVLGLMVFELVSLRNSLQAMKRKAGYEENVLLISKGIALCGMEKAS